MKITLLKATRWALPVVMMLCSQGVMALGLGNATVESYLNQPLQVRIELIARPDEDLNAVTAALASADDFALIGASRDAISVPLRFSIQRDDAGASVRVTSTLPVKDPIIRLIVEVSWPNGRMLREYTLFLDPPTVEAAAPAPVIDQRRDRPQAEPATRPETPVRETAPADSVSREQPRTPVEAVPEEGDYGPVQSGETLWRIATDWSRGSGLNVNQVMLAIQRNNPEAFINDNINLLKRGAILRMPSRGDVAALSPEAARIEVIEQEAALGRAAAPAPRAAVETPLVDDASVAPEFDTAEAPPEPDAQLEIVPPSESEGVDSAYGTETAGAGAEASTSAAGLREELARTEEALISEQQENEFLRDRIAELEGRLASAGEGTVADAEMAAMEDRLREERLADGEAAGAEPGEAADAPEAAVTPAPSVPQVSTSRPSQAESRWYQSVTIWLIIVLVLGAAIAGWVMSRRQAGETLVPAFARSGDETVRGIKDEAQEILRVLEPGEAAGAEADAETTTEAAEETAAPPGKPAAGKKGGDEAELLDESSEDPEVRLDLARAYISMGDREAARVILAEVIEHGNEDQQAEARAMLGEL